MNKKQIITQLLQSLQGQLEAATQSAQATRKGVVHEESRAENDKDTRAIEASYLARGQAKRVEEIQEAIQRVKYMPIPQYGPEDPIGSGALICLEYEDLSRKWYLFVPDAGGTTLTCTRFKVTTITPQSPLGKALVEKQLGDDVEITLKGRHQTVEIVEVF